MRAEAVAQPYWDEGGRGNAFTIGVDLGQAQDYTAICVLESFFQPLREIDPKTGDQKTEPRYEVRHLERPPLGTSYPAIVARVSELMRAPGMIYWKKMWHGGRVIPQLIKPGLVVDATGVGAPVVDLLKAAKLNPVAVTITGGTVQHQPAHRQFNIPKRDLVSALQVAFQNKKLLIAKRLPLASVLVEELKNFRVKVNLATARDSYEPWRTSLHDDLLLATALAYWWAQEQHRHGGGVIPIKGF